MEGERNDWFTRIRGRLQAELVSRFPRVETVRGPADINHESADFLDPRHLIKLGRSTLVVFIVGFIVWAAVAPLSSATLAPGVVVVESRRKAVQHLEGGIVHQVLVADGDKVALGQPLLLLDDTQAGATLNLLKGQVDALSAQEARLIAERDGRDTIEFPLDLVARASDPLPVIRSDAACGIRTGVPVWEMANSSFRASGAAEEKGISKCPNPVSDPKVAEAIRGEVGAFKNRHETLAKQVAILASRTQENARTIGGLEAQQTALATQLALIEQEATMVESLVKRGIEPLPRLLALQRTNADLSGQRGQVIEKMAQVRVNTGETELQIVNLRNQFLADVLKELRDVQTRRFDLQDRMQGALDILNRLKVTAPVEGRIVGLSIHNAGAVIRPGETLMEVVPERDQLVVEAHLRPEDINEVLIGASASVNLTAYKQRRLPVISGTVIGISADRLVDQRTGQAYFAAQISVDRDAWKDYPEVQLVPGMPVDIAVETGSQTILEYLFAPIDAVLRKGMREK